VLGSLAAARVTWSLVGPNAQVASLEGNTLKLGFAAPGLARTFSNARHTSAVEEAVYQTLGIRVRVEATLDEGPSGGGGAAAGGGPSGGGPSAGASSGGGGPVSDEPSSEAPAPTTAPAPDWPDVPPPGGASATVSATPASVEAVAVVGATAMSAVGGGSSGGSVAIAPASAQGSVAVAERPEPSRPGPTGPESGRPEPSRPAARPPAAASAADEAWLSGASATEPPADYDMPEPEPVYEDRAPAEAPAQASVPARAPMSGAVSAREALRQANERRARAASGAAPDPRRDAPAKSGTSPTAAAPAGEPDFYDEPSDDDPDITSAGMVGVPLVVQVLGGTVIEEILEQS
jgi:DNA polymerase-3 subunit gamma/tau